MLVLQIALSVELAGCGRSALVTYLDAAASDHARVDDVAPPDARALDEALEARPRDTARPCVTPPMTPSCSAGWCTVPAGCFLMGSPPDEHCRSYNETQHQVRLTRPFVISRAETTQSEFEAAMGYNPVPYPEDGSDPVPAVSWHEAVSYCNALSKKAGLPECYACSGSGQNVVCSESPPFTGGRLYECEGYRLPSEAEWEYAYRAGTTTAFYSGDLTTCWLPNLAHLYAIAWCDGTPFQPVCTRQPNDLGLCDMAGNLAEWTADWYVEDLGAEPAVDPLAAALGERRVMRGGSSQDPAPTVRAAWRGALRPDLRRWSVGFRCARTL